MYREELRRKLSIISGAGWRKEKEEILVAFSEQTEEIERLKSANVLLRAELEGVCSQFGELIEANKADKQALNRICEPVRGATKDVRRLLANARGSETFPWLREAFIAICDWLDSQESEGEAHGESERGGQ